MIISAARVAQYTKSGETPMCPFGYGYDHGAAFKHLLQVYDIFDNGWDGFFAFIDGKVVFLDRKDAMKHAIECNQVLAGKESYDSLNSELVSHWEKGEGLRRLEDLDYRMRDFYQIVKCRWRIKSGYPNLPALSDEETQKIFTNVAESSKFGSETL